MADTFKKAPGLPAHVTYRHGGNANNTGLVGKVKCRYSDLVAVFGAPNVAGDEDKVDAEWCLTFATDRTAPALVATIYNYKTGRNYLGPSAPPVEEITDWHIGGMSQDVVAYVSGMIDAHRATVATT